MQITLNQSELETAVRDFIVKMGVTRQVSEIKFVASRTQGEGQRMITEIELAETIEEVPPTTAIRSVSAVREAERVAEVVEEEAAPAEPEAAAEAPAEEDEAETGLPAGKSLFG